jgi:hypothetical protein
LIQQVDWKNGTTEMPLPAMPALALKSETPDQKQKKEQ